MERIIKIFNNKKIFVVANNIYLNNNHFKNINFNDSYVLHLNGAIHRNKTEQINKKHQFRILNTHENAKNFKLTEPHIGGIYFYNDLYKDLNLYNSIIFMMYNEMCDKKLNPWFNKYIEYNGPKYIWCCPNLNEWKKEKILPSLGFKVIRFLQNNYKNIEIHLIGFIGHHKLNNGKIYGAGHSLNYEQKYIKKNIPKKQLHFCTKEEIDYY